MQWNPPAYAATETPPSADTSLFRKVDRFFGSSSSWTVQNSLDNADAGMPLVQDCPQLDIITAPVHMHIVY